MLLLTFITQTSRVKSASFFQPACVRLNSYDLQHHCEKQTPCDIHDRSILLLGRQGALIYLSSQDRIALLIYGLINYLDSFCSNIFHLLGRKKKLLLTLSHMPMLYFSLLGKFHLLQTQLLLLTEE